MGYNYMITCMGLIVGSVDSCVRQFTLKKCGEFLRKYPYLLKIENLTFEIDNQPYCMILDIAQSLTDKSKIDVLFATYDGQWYAITI